jgi:hypothetical protein
VPQEGGYQYIEKLESPPNGALIQGRGCDSAWNDALQLKVDSPDKAMATEAILELTEAYYRTEIRNLGGPASVRWNANGEDPKVSARRSLATAITMSRVWAEELYPDIVPSAVQIELHRELPSGRDVTGNVDWFGMWDSLPVIGDNKTGTRRMNQGDADKALQPYMYSWLRSEIADFDPQYFLFARAIDTGKSSTGEFVLTERSQADDLWFDQLLQEVEDAWVKEVFPPRPNSNLCSPKWCPFYAQCQPHRVSRLAAAPEQEEPIDVPA